jgi:nicotinate phosphoribosyltransferase
VGTKLVTGSPVNGVYKLVEIDTIPTMKRSPEKMTYPGKKQIFRQVKASKIMTETLGLATEGDGLLKLVMQNGDRLVPDDHLAVIRQRTDANVATLSTEIRDINYAGLTPVSISPALAKLTQKLNG